MASLNNSILTLQTCTPHQHEGTTNFKPADSFLPPSNFLTRVKSSTRTRSLSSKTSQSFTSIINEFEKEKINKSIDQLEENVNNTKIYEPEVVDRWLEIHGQDDWVCMLDPIDPILGNELIRYGEMAQACYDAFDFDPYSKYCGSCKFPRRKFFDGLGMAEYGYDITRYLCATLPNFFKQSRWPKIWSKNANWIGYVMKICEKLPWSYSHVGVELAFDHKNSPFLKPTSDLVCAHNLEAHLHLLDGPGVHSFSSEQAYGNWRCRGLP